MISCPCVWGGGAVSIISSSLISSYFVDAFFTLVFSLQSCEQPIVFNPLKTIKNEAN